MNRRTVLASLGTGAVALSGCIALGKSSKGNGPAYLGQEPITYYRDDLRLSLTDRPVHLGDTIEFVVTNTSDSSVGLGCKNPWALQYQTSEGWEHVTWTEGRFYNLCLSQLESGESLPEQITLSEQAFEADTYNLQRSMTQGAYRLVLIGPTPYLALQFNVIDE